MRFNHMALYYKPTCPYCLKVLAFMDKNHIEMELRNIQLQENLEDLKELTGKTQVPCLLVHGVPMLESDDIIAYLGDQLKLRASA